MKNKKESYWWLVLLGLSFLLFIFFLPLAFAQQASQTVRVDTTSAGLVAKVAPGEILPISIKLLNFGGGQKVDVTITYGIFDSNGAVIYSAVETVAVETTDNFVKTIQIPFDTPPGSYVAKASIVYEGQLTPATTQFNFTVERKIFGLFQSDFYVYGGLTALISIFMIFIGSFLVRRRKMLRVAPLDYSDIPYDQRVFFELLSDTIMNMRTRVGDAAVDIASHINGLTIDPNTGRILKIQDDPAKIIALLVSGYDKVLGKKVSFTFRKK